MKRLLLWFLSLFSRAKIHQELMENRGHPYRDPWAVEQPIIETIKSESLINKLKKKWNFKMSWNYSLPDTLFGILVFGVLFGGVGFGGYAIFGAATTNKAIDYCYVQYSEYKEKATEREADKARMDAEGNIIRPKYVLMGHVSWDNDRTLAGFDNLADTLKAAEALQCQVK